MAQQSNTVRNREDLRRRLLHDMGIEVWYARRPAQEIGSGDCGEVAAATVVNAKEATKTPVVAGVGGSTQVESPATGSASPTPMPSQPATEVKSEQRDELPFAVVALGVPGALLVADAFQRKREARLARDLIRAARRDWSAGAGQARFDWPQPGVTGASARALAAFIEKQSEDHEARLTLVTESVAGRLGNIPFEFVTVPDLASLGEPANKAALWRFFQGLVLEADR